MAPSGVPLSVVPNPPRGIVGRSVTLDIRGFPERALTYVWYRVSSGTLNQIAAYSVPAGLQSPPDIRERVLPNGSLLIPNLTLSDMGGYMVQIVNFTSGEPLMVPGHLSVYADKSTGLGNDFSYPGGAFVVTVTVIYVVLAVLIVAFTRKSLGRLMMNFMPPWTSMPKRPPAMALSSKTTGIDLDHNEMIGLVLPPSSSPGDFDPRPLPDLSGWKLLSTQPSSTTSGPTPEERRGEIPHSALQDCPAEPLPASALSYQ